MKISPGDMFCLLIPVVVFSVFAAGCSDAVVQEGDAGAAIVCDVAVVGGGSAGFAAAWRAAVSGADVVLVERADRLGGTSVVGGVSSWEPVCGAEGLPELLYERLKSSGMAGVYRFVHHCSWPENGRRCDFPGALLEIDPSARYSQTLRRHGPGMKDEAFFRENCKGIIFDPDAMAQTMEKMLGETSRCRVLLSNEFVSLEKDGGVVRSLMLADGRRIRPSIVIDACGAVASAAGCDLMRSDRPNGATLMYYVEKRAAAQLEELKSCWWRKSYPVAFCVRLPDGRMAVNMLPTMDGSEVARIGKEEALKECMKRCRAHWRWMQDCWPEFASSWSFAGTASVLAERETFRVVCDYVLKAEDVKGAVRPYDEIATADHAFDSHGGAAFRGEIKAPYGIPYRCLLPRGLDNVLVCGRIASFDDRAASSCRLSRTMMKLGEAAGAAAALSLRENVPLRDVSAVKIRAEMGR